MPQLSHPQFASGEAIPSRPASRSSSCVVSRVASKVGSQTNSQATSQKGSPRGHGKEKQGLAGRSSPKDASALWSKSRLAVELLARLNALRRAGQHCEPPDGEPASPPSGGGGSESMARQRWESSSTAAGALALQAESEQVALLNLTLSDTMDTEESLQKRAEMLKAHASDCGRSRHATACLARRTLAVMDEKVKRLMTLQANIDTYLDLTARREKLLRGVLGGEDASDLVKSVGGLKHALAKSVHVEGHSVADDNKSDFQAFLKTVKLPSGHERDVLGRGTLQQGAAQWAASTLMLTREAVEALSGEDGCDTPTVERVVWLAAAVERASTVARAAGVSGSDSMVAQLRQLEQELRQRADELRKNAIELVAHRLIVAAEAEWEGLGRAVHEEPPSSGGKTSQDAANRVRLLLSAGLAKGVPIAHKAVAVCRKVDMDLRAEALFRNALAEVHKDSEQYVSSGYIVDAAVQAADSIEAAVQRAQREGVRPANPRIAEVAAMAKELREQEGLRKRECNAAKRRRETGAGTAGAAASAATLSPVT